MRTENANMNKGIEIALMFAHALVKMLFIIELFSIAFLRLYYQTGILPELTYFSIHLLTHSTILFCKPQYVQSLFAIDTRQELSYKESRVRAKRSSTLNSLRVGTARC